MKAFCISSQLYCKSKTNLKSKIYSKTITQLITSFKPLTKTHKQGRAVGRVYTKCPSFFMVYLQETARRPGRVLTAWTEYDTEYSTACQCIHRNLITLENAGFWAELYINRRRTVILALNLELTVSSWQHLSMSCIFRAEPTGVCRATWWNYS